MSDANCLGRLGSMRVVLAKRNAPTLIDQNHRVARKPVKFRNNPANTHPSRAVIELSVVNSGPGWWIDASDRGRHRATDYKVRADEGHRHEHQHVRDRYPDRLYDHVRESHGAK